MFSCITSGVEEGEQFRRSKKYSGGASSGYLSKGICRRGSLRMLNHTILCMTGTWRLFAVIDFREDTSSIKSRVPLRRASFSVVTAVIRCCKFAIFSFCLLTSLTWEQSSTKAALADVFAFSKPCTRLSTVSNLEHLNAVYSSVSKSYWVATEQVSGVAHCVAMSSTSCSTGGGGGFAHAIFSRLVCCHRGIVCDWGQQAYGCRGAHEAALVTGRRIRSVRSLIHAF